MKQLCETFVTTMMVTTVMMTIRLQAIASAAIIIAKFCTYVIVTWSCAGLTLLFRVKIALWIRRFSISRDRARDSVKKYHFREKRCTNNEIFLQKLNILSSADVARFSRTLRRYDRILFPIFSSYDIRPALFPSQLVPLVPQDHLAANCSFCRTGMLVVSFNRLSVSLYIQ